MRILILSDAWMPQTNGVVRTLATLADILTRRGHAVLVIHPGDFRTLPFRFYQDIVLALPTISSLTQRVKEFQPDVIHLATEGPVGWAGRRLCLREGREFTTCVHTHFHRYLWKMFWIPPALTLWVMRTFHRPAAGVMVATTTLENELRRCGFRNRFLHFGRGVDLKTFRPQPLQDVYPRPLLLYVGRVSVEKSVEDFLKLEHPGTKVVVGDGPQLTRFRALYPQVHFLGRKTGEELSFWYSQADCFVFPSRTDTFGLVMLEALASGVPVAAYPVPGPIDVITDPAVGCLRPSLCEAVVEALQCDRVACRRYAERYSWEVIADEFELALQCRSS